MKNILLPAALMCVMTMSLELLAQQPNSPSGDSDSEQTLSPEMWYYKQQLERYDDPKTAVRRNAEFQAQQRLARMEALKWYGFSNARPTASPTPFTSMYSPAWQSNWYRPYAWYPSSRPLIIYSGR